MRTQSTRDQVTKTTLYFSLRTVLAIRESPHTRIGYIKKTTKVSE